MDNLHIKPQPGIRDDNTDQMMDKVANQMIIDIQKGIAFNSFVNIENVSDLKTTEWQFKINHVDRVISENDDLLKFGQDEDAKITGNHGLNFKIKPETEAAILRKQLSYLSLLKSNHPLGSINRHRYNLAMNEMARLILFIEGKPLSHLNIANLVNYGR